MEANEGVGKLSRTRSEVSLTLYAGGRSSETLSSMVSGKN
jgi:hypothetical protein